MKLFVLTMLLLTLWGCANPPQLATSLDVQKSPDNSLVVLQLKVTNLEDRVTVPIAVELTGQARTNGQWSKPETLVHPAAFVLNRKEQRGITKPWRVQADAVRTTLVVKEQESGHILKSEKAEKVFAGSGG
ncbi:MAG TPA: hypothetical protein VK776_14280 [Bryobacteraceae bacterium]|nr:hypothetical protein [Bryobacteraceae bacterium]